MSAEGNQEVTKEVKMRIGGTAFDCDSSKPKADRRLETLDLGQNKVE